MKNKRNWTKVAAALGMLVISATLAQAQTTTAWPVSKDVQRYANKSLADQSLQQSHIQATTADASWTISKRVQPKRTGAAQGNVASKGIPAWTISKGVQRINK